MALFNLATFVAIGVLRWPILPVLAGICCAFLAGPWTGREPVQYNVAGGELGIGVVLWWEHEGAGTLGGMVWRNDDRSDALNLVPLLWQYRPDLP